MTAEGLAWKPSWRATLRQWIISIGWCRRSRSTIPACTRATGASPRRLLTISLVVSVMLVAVALLRGMGVAWAEYLLFAGCILTPVIGAVLIRPPASIGLGFVATNLGGIVVVTAWAWLSGGILSMALPAFWPTSPCSAPSATSAS
jgi:hypothetical protein